MEKRVAQVLYQIRKAKEILWKGSKKGTSAANAKNKRAIIGFLHKCFDIAINGERIRDQTVV